MIEVDIEHIAALDRDRVEELVGDIVKEGKKSGFVGYYRYRVYEEADKNTIVVLNCFLQLQSAHNVLQVTLLVFLCCVAIVFFPSAAFLRQGDASLCGKHGAPEALYHGCFP